ncbi:hypothetical protein EST38_g5823 [Candolleomyces aberdarensis]|uniref:Translation initiation factor 3 N-terminal domain-containing protein n=1 Tax=Candolleomyces aberdarensis TaxID=2316362 RepID=A0A4V1Q3W7_9AGAR|nr:hypothetical protein EST38_g5823 [Candolleomyces aberdarensis]
MNPNSFLAFRSAAFTALRHQPGTSGTQALRLAAAIPRAAQCSRRPTTYLISSSSLHSTSITLQKYQRDDPRQPKAKRPEIPQHKPTPKPRRGNKIKIEYVHLLDPTTDSIGPLRRLSDILDSVSEDDGFVVELVQEHPDPIVKIVDLKSSRAQTLKQRQIEKRMAGGSQEVLKEAHFTWSMADADFQHRFQKLQDDLSKGNCRVDVVFANKRGHKPLPPHEREERVRELVESLEEVSKEWKPHETKGTYAYVYLQSKVKVSNKVNIEELKESVPKHIQQKEERRLRQQKNLEKQRAAGQSSEYGSLWGV